LPILGLVSGEQVIESSILANDHDNVFDGSRCLPVAIIGTRGDGEQAAETELK
jgi:hypothetical protein